VRDVRLTAQDRIAFYQKKYDLEKDTDFLRLNSAYIAANMRDKALELCENYVAKKPFSFVGLYILLEHYIIANDRYKANKVVNRLAHVYIFPERVLDSISGLQDSRDDFAYVQSLKNEYQGFIANYKNNPAGGEKVFDGIAGKKMRWEALRLTLKASAYGFLQRHYIKENDIPNAERVSDLSLKLTINIAKAYKDCYIPARFLDETLRYLAYYYVAKSEYDKLFNFSVLCARVFEDDYAGVDYVFVHDGLGFANLNKAIALDVRRDYGDEFFRCIDKALKAYSLIIPQGENMGQSNLRSVSQEIGHCYFLRAKAYLAKNDRVRAAEQCNYAFTYFEQGIAIDPVYGRDILKLRALLLALAQKERLALRLVDGIK
jgi:hypothetical protein